MCIFCVTGLFLPFSFFFENLHGKLTRGVHAQRLTAVINVYFSAVISIEANSTSNTTIKCNFNKVHYLFILQLTHVLSCEYIRLTIKEII